MGDHKHEIHFQVTDVFTDQKYPSTITAGMFIFKEYSGQSQVIYTLEIFTSVSFWCIKEHVLDTLLH